MGAAMGHHFAVRDVWATLPAQVRVRMQQAAAPWPSAAACLRATVGREGPSALLRGLSYPLATISVQARRSSQHAV